MSIKDPIYSVNKNQLKNIIKDRLTGYICRSELFGIDRDHIISIIKDAVNRVNIIVFYAYNLIKLYVLYLYDNNLPIPLIDKDFITIVIRVVSYRTETKGAKMSEYKQISYDALVRFFNKYYKPLIQEEDLVCDDKLSYILSNYEIPDMVKNINNNIKEHFADHVRKYVNDYFNVKDRIDKIRSNRKLSDSQQKAEIRGISACFNSIKFDLLSVNEPFKSHEKYHHWINDMREIILPKREFLKDSIFYDVEVNPQDYLPGLITINKLIEKLSHDRDIKYKLFNVVPLRTAISPKYITIDTCVLNSLFSGKRDNFLDVAACTIPLWTAIFDFNSRAFKRSNYKFHFMIKTDGVGCSILFEKLTGEEKKPVKISPGNYDIEIESNKIINAPRKVKFKYRKNKKGKTKKQKKRQKKGKEKIDYDDPNMFKYIEEVAITEEMRHKKIVAIDPGHNDLINCIMQFDQPTEIVNNVKINGNIIECDTKLVTDIKFRYTRKQRNRESKTIRYRKIINRVKDKSIKKLETELSKYNSKTCDFNNFLAYLAKKIAINRQLYSHYQQDIYRKLKLNRYINTQKSETKMLKEFEKKFGDPSQVIVIFGDYDVKNTNKGSEPQITKRVKKLLREYGYEVYLINEYNTSKLCNRCSCETERFKHFSLGKTDKKTGELRVREYLLWKLLRCKNEKCATYHNRDHNAVRNMIKITRHIYEGQGRPIEYVKEEKINK